MGQLINGLWDNQSPDSHQKPAQFRNWITPDGQPGPTGIGGFKAESGRYHLYVSYACPWAHRTIIFRQLKGLNDHVSMSLLHPHMLSRGWEFIPTHPLFRDPVNYARCLYEIYLLSDPFYSGPVSIPVLWDKQSRQIVSNESSEIIRMFNSAFNTITGNLNDYYPEPLRLEIDKINTFVYENVNSGVYQCGMATKQSAYEAAFYKLFAALDVLDKTLGEKTYLLGDTLTEADWRLFTTLIRFDCVYYSHFKCNLKLITDYKNLSRFMKALYNIPGIAQTINFEHIKQHYYYSQVNINPTQIVPKGPLLKL